MSNKPYTAESIGDFEINMVRMMYVDDAEIRGICDAAQAPGEYYTAGGSPLVSPLDGQLTTRREMRQLVANKLNETMA